jgi:hypothetical protein
MNITFELAPGFRRQNWDHALAFGLISGAAAGAATWFVTAHHVALTLTVAAVCLAGTVLVALTLGFVRGGHVTLARDTLHLRSGFLEVTLPLAELDLAAARRGDQAGASPRLVTRLDRAVTLPRHQGPPVVITPLDPDHFLHTLHGRRHSSPLLATV